MYASLTSNKPESKRNHNNYIYIYFVYVIIIYTVKNSTNGAEDRLKSFRNDDLDNLPNCVLDIREQYYFGDSNYTRSPLALFIIFVIIIIIIIIIWTRSDFLVYLCV